MQLESFIARSLGRWRSMRSGHSLAFQQFEDVRSLILIEPIETQDPLVLKLLEECRIHDAKPCLPFRMEWNAESDWEPDGPSEVSAGSCILVPIPYDKKKGILLRSAGYAEVEQAISNYTFLEDNTFTLTTHYGQSIAEERIWFVSDNVRCRSSVLRTSAGSGVLQTSFASEIRRLDSLY